MEMISEQCCFGGRQGRYSHASTATGTTMQFSVYQPPQATHGKVPALYYLAGLSCSDETFMTKAGAQRLAAELGVMLVRTEGRRGGKGCGSTGKSWRSA